MVSFSYWQPGKVIFGRGTLERLGAEVSRLGEKALLVTGRRFARTYGYTERIAKLIRAEGAEVILFEEVEPNPSLGTVDRGAEIARREKADVVVAFGGGSPMDAAKAISVVASLGGRAKDYIYPHIVEGEITPIVAIPTTAGTGSEVTKYSVLTDVERRKKVVIVGPPIIPKVAILDPEVLAHMPKELTAWTGFDALSHAVEAYLSKMATPLSELYGLEAVRIIFQHLAEAVRGSRDSRERVFYASFLAGLAINQSGTVMVHGLGYYLTNYHNIHHGLANAMLLPYSVHYVLPAARDKVASLSIVVGRGPNPEEFVEALFDLRDRTGIPRSLQDLGVSPSELDRMVEDSLSYERNLANNPVEVDEEAARTVYEQALRGLRDL